MTTISASVIADSVSLRGHRLTTLELCYPRFIHAEFMTHRVFSRSASSSRAIPVKRLIEDIKKDPAMPLFWGKNQKGMQAGGECNELVTIPEAEFYDAREDDVEAAFKPIEREEAWSWALYQALTAAKAFDAAGYHKQIVNRLLEPFAHIRVICTATEWENFFALRDHSDAEPHIQLLARRMKMAMEYSKPRLILDHEWHLPYWGNTIEDIKDVSDYCLAKNIPGALLIELVKKISAARCARVSYKTHDGYRPTAEEDLELFERLAGSHPKHLSPLEHQAKPLPHGLWSANFHGWEQQRKRYE